MRHNYVLRSILVRTYHHFTKAESTRECVAFKWKWDNLPNRCSGLTGGFSTRNFHRNPHYGWSVANMAQLDSQQLALLNEPCIVVDNFDCPIGMETKKACHLLTKESKGILHRAFSVFLFDLDGKLLLQQRSMAKITFPGYYTNTCCSHPLYMPSEMELENAVGVKRAAQRRLEIELGIPKEQIPLESFHYITRIHYCSPYDDQWGEHEIDYILLLKADVTVNSNPNEVKNYRFVSRNDLPSFLENLEKQNIPITPWFRLIVNNFLMHWWTNLSNVESIQDHLIIHRL